MSYTPPPSYLFGETSVELGAEVNTTTTTTTCFEGIVPAPPGIVVAPAVPVPVYLIGSTSEYIGVETGYNSSCESVPVICPPEGPCPTLLSSDCVFYSGSNLVNTDIDQHDTLTVMIQKIDALLENPGDKHFTFIQGIVSAVWVIKHDLNKYPSIRVIDNGGTEVEGFKQDIDTKNLTITFSSGFAGKAYLN